MHVFVCMYVLYICPCKPIYVSHARVYDDMVYLHFFTHTKYTDIYVCNDECMFLSTIINLIRLYLLLVNRIVSYEQLFEEAKRR